MFPPSLYDYVQKMDKEMILVLNKIDLAPAEVVVAWKYYFISKFPNIRVVTFTSYPSYNLRGNSENKSGETVIFSLVSGRCTNLQEIIAMINLDRN